MVSQSLVRIRSVFMLACYTQSTTSNRVFDLAKLLPLGSHAPAVPSFVGPSSCALDGHCHSVVSFFTNAFVDAIRPWGVVLLLMATYLWGEFAPYIQACTQATILRVDLFSLDPPGFLSLVWYLRLLWFWILVNQLAIEQKSSRCGKRPSSVDSESGEKLERDSATPVSPAVHRFVGYLELENAAWPLEDEKYKVKGRARLILHLVSYQRMIG